MSTCNRVLGSAIIAGCLVWGQNDTVITPKQKNWDERANRGECTIRVWVDDEADIELRGNSVRIRVLSGQPGRDDGSECNQPLPGNLTNFEFKGIDGRGEVRLVQEPRAANNWTAIVNIKDRKGGGEGYTYRLRWESPGGYAANSNQSSDQRDRRGRNDRRTHRGRNTTGNTTSNDLPWWGSGNTSGNTTNLGSTFALNQSGSGSLDLDGRNWQINRTRIDARSNRDVRIFLTPTSGREFEFRGEITRQQGSSLEINIIDSTEGRASGRMTVNVLGNDGVDSLSMNGTMNNRSVRADFRR